MFYSGYQAQADAIEPLRYLARAAGHSLGQAAPGNGEGYWVRHLAALGQVIARAGLTHRRPAFGIDAVAVGGREVVVREHAVHRTPFCTLLHFEKESVAPQARVLLVAPMSGHFATLLRDTVRTMLPDHDVYLTDWHNPRDIPAREGHFGVGSFIEHLIAFLEVMGPGSHILAICQPSVAALAAVAIMAEDENPALPLSMTLMAGPIDTRINPTKVNEFATSKPIDWFERSLISAVPIGFAGAGRKVYPGFLQLTAFMNMNMDRHVKSFHDLYNHLVKGEHEKAEAVQKFYEEYFAVMDLTAEFYLETVRAVFQEHDLPRGALEIRGRRVDTRAIRRTQLLTIEGERDDICAIGQTLAAQDLCSGIRPYMKRHYMQTGVGHYGVFSGRRWATQIYPIVRDVIQASQ
ncbi:MAG TPA: polyhydroxyalkanoate depolymerase [Stellaceae bacterium]|nr:polyhydroxyalkanoate depolymerase [Stellaceae bacterium]